jgi:hypothetical protein
MGYRILLLLICLSLIACKHESQKNLELVNLVKSPAGKQSSLPFLYTNEDKTLFSWVEKVNDSLTELKYAELIKGEWQASESIIKDSDWFVNWADFPAIAENDGNLISHVLKKSSEGTYSYDVKLSVKPKGERFWKTNRSLHTDGTATEHGFVSTVPYKDGFFTTWLDGRNTLEDENGDRGAMTLRAAEVSANGSVSKEIELDQRICDCCQTTAVITENGPAVLYRDRSEEEVRDMSIVRWENEKWTKPKTVFADNWKIEGCPVNGPKADALESTLAMAWFTAATEKPKVQLIFSGNNGVNFDQPIKVSENNVIGRVDVLLVDEKFAIVSWMEASEGTAQLKAMQLNRDGSKGKSIIVSEMDATRQSGFPQMERVEDKVYFAWTDLSESKSEVKMVFVPLSRF